MFDRKPPIRTAPPGFARAMADVLGSVETILDTMADQTGDPAWSLLASELDRLVRVAIVMRVAAPPRRDRPYSWPVACTMYDRAASPEVARAMAGILSSAAALLEAMADLTNDSGWSALASELDELALQIRGLADGAHPRTARVTYPMRCVN